jgi:hypothetical protein
MKPIQIRINTETGGVRQYYVANEVAYQYSVAKLTFCRRKADMDILVIVKEIKDHCPAYRK